MVNLAPSFKSFQHRIVLEKSVQDHGKDDEIATDTGSRYIETLEVRGHWATMEEFLEVVTFLLPRFKNTVKM